MKNLLKLYLCFTLIIISGKISAQINFFPNASHPRLLLLKGEEEILLSKIKSNSTWIQVHQEIINKCDEFLRTKPVQKIKIGKRLLDKATTALHRIYFLAYAYRMTKDDKYFKRAEEELLAVSTFDDWNPSHFLDVAEMTMAVSIGYDWLYEKLAPQSREIMLEAIISKGLNPSLLIKNNNWLKRDNNWNQVCNGGMVFGAIAIQDSNPELSKQIINRAINTVKLPMEAYGPDGNYTEGYGYWNYGTTFNVMMISALEKLFKTDFGLSKFEGFMKTANYLPNMTGPSGMSFNYFDSGLSGHLNPAMFWFANKTKNQSILWIEQNYLSNDKIKRLPGDRLLPSLLIWANGVELNKIKPPKEHIWVGNGKNSVAILHSSWSDPNAIYVGIKGGSASLSHAHMDAGSFVMEANGERWAMDFGAQNYESLESKGVDLWNTKQNSQRWEILRYNNFFHNTLTINNQLQNVTGNASIIQYSKNKKFINAVVDLSSIYNSELNKALRGIAIVDGKFVLIRDEVETKANESVLRWSMLTSTEVKILSKNEFELTKNGKKLIVKVDSPTDFTLKTWSTEPIHDYDSKNPGTKVIGFEAKLSANSKSYFNVYLLPEGNLNTNDKVNLIESWKRN
jgi:hypothetical protein